MRASSPGRVIVNGAGPSGLVLACELALAGVPCRVLDRHDRRGDDGWMLGIHDRTMDLFDLRGQADQFVRRGTPVTRIRLSCGGSVNLGGTASRFACLQVMPQSVTQVVAGW